ncbi:MAG: S-4TM family putative pore-forming effector [Candidatus Izemoplasmatales bacterium]|nr:S-4TM family putative pore-forming effector [Candidatus Izemoplasmatales bacterium]
MSRKQPGIQKRQNEAEMQLLIIAQHFTYKCAKKWVLFLFIVCVIFPIGINIALYFAINDIHTGVLALTSISLLFIGDFISKEIERVKKKAAMLQQKFDLHVFRLDIASGIDDNIIAEQQEKYKNRDWYRKANWYANYESMDIDKAIFYSQRENIDWTKNIANRYRYFLVGITIIALLTFGLNLVLNNSSVVKMLSILMTAIPLIIYAKTGYYKIKQDNENLARIIKFADEIQSNINEISPEKLKNSTYILQITIYKFRQEKYLIPDWFENRYYKHLQAIENRKAGQRSQLEKKRTVTKKNSDKKRA